MIELLKTGNFSISAILPLILIIVILVIIVIVILTLKKSRKGRDDSVDYLAALNYLLVGERQKALTNLRKTVQKNTANVDAYIKIGDILRDKGHIERAIKIHRGLTVRSDLTTLERIEILRSLVKDYRAAKKYDNALIHCQSLLELTKNEQWFQELQIKLLEEKGDWDKAFEVRKKYNRAKGIKKDKILALYKVEAGLKLVADGKEHDGRVKYREAIKVDKKCASAYLNLSDSYIRENRLSDALTELKRFIEQVPDLAYLAFDQIKELLFQKGNFGEIEYIYNLLLKSNPNINSIRFALADIYERKGAFAKAIDLCREELDKNPDSKSAKQYLVKYYAKTNQRDKALDLSLELIDTSFTEEKKYSCKNCGFTANKPYWHCPQCKEWDSFLN